MDAVYPHPAGDGIRARPVSPNGAPGAVATVAGGLIIGQAVRLDLKLYLYDAIFR